MNEPPQISRTASAADDAWTTVNPSASRARVTSSRSVLFSLTTRTEDIGDLATRGTRELCSMPPEWAAFFTMLDTRYVRLSRVKLAEIHNFRGGSDHTHAQGARFTQTCASGI